MAFDQVSLFLYPPRWERQSAPSRMMRYSGEPVQIVSAARGASVCGPAVRFDHLCQWFRTKGFEVVVRSPDFGEFHSGVVESPHGRRAEIDVHTAVNDGEVTNLYCRFLLTRETPMRLERWEAFMQELCTAFPLRIAVSDNEYVGADGFLAVVRRGDNFRYFANQFGWSLDDGQNE